MNGYWWGVLTPFMIVLAILLLYLLGNLFAAPTTSDRSACGDHAGATASSNPKNRKEKMTNEQAADH